MQDNKQAATNRSLPVVLVAAVIQGWALYLLHQSIKHHAWPATDSGWLFALYAVAIVVPLTSQWLADFIKARQTWMLIGAISVAYCYFGWHYGTHVYGPIKPDSADRYIGSEDFVAAGFIVGLLWLLFMPFIQARLIANKWTADYPLFFTTAWRNKLILAEAAAFTGLFWLLLGLWQMLFHMLGIDFFKELFSKPLFIYPVTSITFGVALHLIGSIDKLTNVILEQTLSVLKWLAIVAGFILSIFTLALIFKLPGLVFHGQKAIGAAWLLWLVAVNVLLINAAYRDGTNERAYPSWIALALRFVLPFTVIVSFTAIFSLIVRTHHYGLTVERIWALLTALAACIYSVGYSWAAIRKGPWLQGIARVNIVAALVLIGIVTATMTPILSPYRLAAANQFHRALNVNAETDDDRDTPGNPAMHYLRFSAGQYGVERMHELSELQDHPNAEQIRKQAKSLLQAKNSWESPKLDTQSILTLLTIAPTGRQVDAALAATLEKEMSATAHVYLFSNAKRFPPAGVFVDLTADGVDEFVLITVHGGLVFRRKDKDWQFATTISHPYFEESNWTGFRKDVETGRFTVKQREMADLQIGSVAIKMAEQ